MCHAFIKNQALLFPPIAFLNSSKGSRNDLALQNTQIASDDEQGNVPKFNSA
jgi:hypothetical protein